MTISMLVGCGKPNANVLTIAKQGTFTAGGKVTSTEGTYNPKTLFDTHGQTTKDIICSKEYQLLF